MICFEKSSVQDEVYDVNDNLIQYNSPVNTNLCMGIKKGTAYIDELKYTGEDEDFYNPTGLVYTIEFRFINGKKVTWLYQSESERNDEYDNLMGEVVIVPV